MKFLTPSPILDHFGLSSFVCFDFETTGLDPALCDIIEVGAVKVIDGEIKDEFQSLVSIESELPEVITNLTGITQSDLLDQPNINQVISDFVSFVDELPLVAHNLSFDLGFLQESLLRLSEFNLLEKLKLDSNKHWDILLLVRMLFPFFRSHRLESLIDFFKIESETQHRALDDVYAEIQIFDRLFLKALELTNESLAQLVSISQGKSKFFSLFIHALHELRSRKYNLLLENPIPSIKFDYSINQNILLKKHQDEVSQEVPFDSDQVVSVFEKDGMFSQSLPTYELRYEQIEMVKVICRAYENEEFLIVEAGTGTGKSWAYLVPSIFWAQSHGTVNGRTVISTNTKNLQEQIFYKDLPLLHENLSVDFQAVLLKGRGNYLCLNRWHNFLAQLDFTSDNKLLEEILPLVVWSNETKTGDIEEIGWFNPQRSSRIWWQIRSDGYYCKGQACRFKDQCFVNKIRRAAKNAEIVVINHSLLLSDLISENAVLSDYSNLVIDEAHNLENTATQYLGREWSFWSLNQLILPLISSGGETRNELKVLDQLLKRQKELNESERKTILNNCNQIQIEADYLKKTNDNFFKKLPLEIDELKVGKNGYVNKLRYQKWTQEYPYFVEITDDLIQTIELLEKELVRLNSNLSSISSSKFSKDDQTIFEDSVAFFNGIAVTLKEWIFTINHLLKNNEENFVFWIENSNRREAINFHFKSAPLNVASLLKEFLYEKLSTAVFTSATLSINQEFNFFEERLGIELIPIERRNSKIVGSPFDYENQMLVLIPQYMPNPKQNLFINKSSEIIEKVLITSKRSTLVLFTSYKMLNQIYDQINLDLKTNEFTVVAQGKSGSRSTLLRMLRDQKAHMLLGTHSFWEGVDLPGEALEILIMTKLPFEVPSEPIVQARIEQIDQMGKNSFYNYSLPNAVLKFRQGVGRLIRSQQDKGVVILLDSRLTNSRYGSLFLNSMPVTPQIAENEELFFSTLQNWFLLD